MENLEQCFLRSLGFDLAVGELWRAQRNRGVREPRKENQMHLCGETVSQSGMLQALGRLVFLLSC